MPRPSALTDAPAEAPEQGASSLSPDLDIRALILDLTAKFDATVSAQAAEIDALKSEVREQRARIPTFQPSQTKTDYAAMFGGLDASGPFREGRELLNRTGVR